MRQLWTGLLLASLAALPACAGGRMDATEPTVSYSFDDEDEYQLVAEKADDYCEDEYARDAVLVDQDEDDDGDYEATFACK